MARFQYLFKVLKSRLNNNVASCPYCRNKNFTKLGTKHFFVELLRCNNCQLMYRFPADSQNNNVNFYQRDYRESITSDIPNDQKLEEYLVNSFSGTQKDLSAKIEILRKIQSSGRVLDFGCSWGYNTWQLQRAGYDPIGFEISKLRADFAAEKLGLKIISDYSRLISLKQGSFDIILSNHVFEHLPNLYSIFDDFYKLLSNNGYILLFFPNCIGMDNPKIFSVKKSYAFGEKHTFAFDKIFFETNLPKHGFEVRCASSPYNINSLFAKQEKLQNLEYSELFVLMKKTGLASQHIQIQI